MRKVIADWAQFYRKSTLSLIAAPDYASLARFSAIWKGCGDDRQQRIRRLTAACGTLSQPDQDLIWGGD